MQNNTIVPPDAAAGGATIVSQACSKISGFFELLQEMERSIVINGKSKSTYDNYSRQLAHLALHYNQHPLELRANQVTEYLYLLKTNQNVSESFFRFTVYGMRYACKVRGIDENQYRLPVIKHDKKLPEVLNQAEMKALMAACKPLKHRLIIGILFGCGLRIAELHKLEVSHIDLERRLLHVHGGKGSKDRVVPIGTMLQKGIAKYIEVVCPEKYLFEGRVVGSPMAIPSLQSAIKMLATKAGIKKNISAHILRHSFATHCLENGVNLLTIKELLGHQRIETTMIYLHVARPRDTTAICPLDKLYRKEEQK